MQFYSYPLKASLPDLSNYVILSLNGPLLSREDAQMGLLLIDGTWRHAETMLKFLNQHMNLPRRSLAPKLRTAYPRRQEDCDDPNRGLASVEALYAAYQITGRNSEGLLDNYHWKDQFLRQRALL